MEGRGYVCARLGACRVVVTLLGGCKVARYILSTKDHGIPFIRSVRRSPRFRYCSMISREDTKCFTLKLTRRLGRPIIVSYASSATAYGC